MKYAIAEIEKMVQRAEEIMALDHHRTETVDGVFFKNCWAYDFGALGSCVTGIREALGRIPEASRV